MFLRLDRQENVIRLVFCALFLPPKMWNQVLFPLTINRCETRFYFPLQSTDVKPGFIFPLQSTLNVCRAKILHFLFHMCFENVLTDAIIFSLIKYEAITVVVFLFRKRLECFKYLTLLVSVGNWLSVAVMHYIYLAVSIFHCLSFIQALFLHHSISIALMLVRKHFMNKHFF